MIKHADKGMKVEIVEISTLERGPETQMRVALNEDVVKRFADLMQDTTVFYEFPPIDIYRATDKVFGGILSDGHHRVEAATRSGHKEITARVFEGTLDDALWHAFIQNQKNATALTDEDVTRAVEIAVTRWPERSTTDIAKAIGCSQAKVSRVKQRLIQVNKIAAPEVTIGIDGVERKVPIRQTRNERADYYSADDDPEELELAPTGSDGLVKPNKPDQSPQQRLAVVMDQCRMLADKLDDALTEAYEISCKHGMNDEYDDMYYDVVKKITGEDANALATV